MNPNNRFTHQSPVIPRNLLSDPMDIRDDHTWSERCFRCSAAKQLLPPFPLLCFHYLILCSSSFLSFLHLANICIFTPIIVFLLLILINLGHITNGGASETINKIFHMICKRKSVTFSYSFSPSRANDCRVTRDFNVLSFFIYLMVLVGLGWGPWE